MHWIEDTHAFPNGQQSQGLLSERHAKDESMKSNRYNFYEVVRFILALCRKMTRIVVEHERGGSWMPETGFGQFTNPEHHENRGLSIFVQSQPSDPLVPKR